MGLYYMASTAAAVFTPLIPLAIAWRLLRVLAMIRRGARTTVPHEGAAFLFSLYLCALALITVNLARVLALDFALTPGYNLIPFAEIHRFLIGGNTPVMLLNIAGNILLYLPLGFGLPLLWRRWGRAWRTIPFCALVSLSIECLQLFTGRVCDVDDLILNTLGAALGYLAFAVLRAAAPHAVREFRTRRAPAAVPAPDRV